jgi:hypothetical protein
LTLQGDQALHPAVRAATEFAKNCLNKYWFNADDSDVYRIAMSNSYFNCYIFVSFLHSSAPRNETEILQGGRLGRRGLYRGSQILGCGCLWCILRRRTSLGGACPFYFSGIVLCLYSTDNLVSQAAVEEDNITADTFLNFSLTSVAHPAASELQDYLTLDVENVKDPLKWWWDHRRTYPALSRMAFDYLFRVSHYLFLST